MYASLVLEDIYQAAPMNSPTGLACKKEEIVLHHGGQNRPQRIHVNHITFTTFIHVIFLRGMAC